ncbi:Acyl-CoA dehydrogenase, N-terminal domain [Paracoccus pantotrophus]|nr:Acyl-CoA dehydrogenase, N-terminal domain [Paracoccus pantotrophus]
MLFVSSLRPYTVMTTGKQVAGLGDVAGLKLRANGAAMEKAVRVPSPEAYGGAGLGISEAAIFLRAMTESGGAVQAASAIHLDILCLAPIVLFGTEKQRQRMLLPMIQGRAMACFGITEPDAGLNITKLKTRAMRQVLREQFAAGLCRRTEWAALRVRPRPASPRCFRSRRLPRICICAPAPAPRWPRYAGRARGRAAVRGCAALQPHARMVPRPAGAAGALRGWGVTNDELAGLRQAGVLLNRME